MGFYSDNMATVFFKHEIVYQKIIIFEEKDFYFLLIAYQFINALLIDRVELLFSLKINNSNKNRKN